MSPKDSSGGRRVDDPLRGNAIIRRWQCGRVLRRHSDRPVAAFVGVKRIVSVRSQGHVGLARSCEQHSGRHRSPRSFWF
jgi:hypothetical protein